MSIFIRINISIHLFFIESHSSNYSINYYFDSLLRSIRKNYLAAIADGDENSDNWTSLNARIVLFHGRIIELCETSTPLSTNVWFMIAHLNAFMDSCWNEIVVINFYSHEPMMSIEKTIKNHPKL